MSMVLMGFGEFRFGVPKLNFDQMTREWEFRWAPQKVVGGRPILHFHGPDVEYIRLKGVMYPLDPRFRGSYSRFETLRSENTARTPRPLAASTGRHFGLWVLQSVRDTQEYFAPNGAPRKLEFDIEFAHFGRTLPGLGAVSLGFSVEL